jgi:hypothetical protein
MSKACIESGIARFVMVYTWEAHASDEWPIGQEICPLQHSLIQDRASGATKMRSIGLDATVEMALAPLDGDFDRLYKPWPFRFFIIDQGKIVQSPSPVGEVYNIGEIWDFIDKMKSLSQTRSGTNASE